MPFALEDLQILLALLQERPEWRERLREIVISQDLLTLPHYMAELAAAQKQTEASLTAVTGLVSQLVLSQQRTDERLAELAIAQQRTEARVEELAIAQQRTEARVEELAIAQQRTEARVEELAIAQQRMEARLDALTQRVEELAIAQQRTEARVEELAIAQQRTEARVEELVIAQQRTEARLDALTQQVMELVEAQKRMDADLRTLTKRVDRMDVQIGQLRGQLLEQKYRDRAGAYFGKLLRKVRAINNEQLADLLEDSLTREQFDEAINIDLVVRGRLRQPANLAGTEILLAVEISTVIDVHDVERAWRRARTIALAGTPTIAVVAGEEIIPEALQLAESSQVTVLENGSTQFWEEALSNSTQS